MVGLGQNLKFQETCRNGSILQLYESSSVQKFASKNINTVNVVISRCCLAEDGTDLFIRACCTCSTIIFPYSTSQILNYGAVVAVPVVDGTTLY